MSEQEVIDPNEMLTPGPWEPVRSVTCGHLRAGHNYQSDPKKEWTDKDLRVIALAPDMLRACNMAMDACRENLRAWQYKNEIVLHEAMKECERIIELASAQKAESK